MEIISKFCPAVMTVTIKHRKASSRIHKCNEDMYIYLKFLTTASTDSIIITTKQKLWTDFTLPLWHIRYSKEVSLRIGTCFRGIINNENFGNPHDMLLVLLLLPSWDVCIKIKKKNSKGSNIIFTSSKKPANWPVS